MKKIIRCDSCSRRYRGSGEWNVTMSHGVAVGYLCPDCQTSEQNAEAEINAATLDYARTPFGFMARPKVADE